MSVLQDNINTLDNRFGMRMFIADLPRVLNETFNVIKNVFVKIYDANENKLKADKADITTLTSSTIITNNIVIKDSSTGKTLSFNELDDIVKIKEDIEKIKFNLGI